MYMGLLLSSGKAWAAYWVWATKDGLKPIKPRFLYSVFVNGTVEEWNGRPTSFPKNYS
jgi:hypothetical protein